MTSRLVKLLLFILEACPRSYILLLVVKKVSYRGSPINYSYLSIVANTYKKINKKLLIKIREIIIIKRKRKSSSSKFLMTQDTESLS